jgi:hypothetical protein
MKKVKRPVKPANMALPARWDAAPVAAGEEEGDSDVEVPFSVRLPPEPAVDVGDTFSVAFSEAFLKASRVLGPEALDNVSQSKHFQHQ